MPTVIMNDVEMEARLGERLLSVARRNSAHIGFVCDGNGICQTCQCRVLQGAEMLSPPNEAERTWMPERRLAAGNRLACQTAIRGNGTIEVITTVEELRRQTVGALRPGDDDYRDNLQALLENIVWLNVDQLAKFPFNILATVGRVGVGRFLWPIKDLERYIGDGTRVTRRVVSGVDRIMAPQESGDPAPRALPRPAENPLEAKALEAARAVRRASQDVKRYR